MPHYWSSTARNTEGLVFILAFAGTAPSGTVLKVIVPNVPCWLSCLHPSAFSSSRWWSRCLGSCGWSSTAARAFIHIDITLTKCFAGPALVSLRCIECFVRPIERHMNFYRGINQKIYSHIVGGRAVCGGVQFCLQWDSTFAMLKRACQGTCKGRTFQKVNQPKTEGYQAAVSSINSWIEYMKIRRRRKTLSCWITQWFTHMKEKVCSKFN